MPGEMHAPNAVGKGEENTEGNPWWSARCTACLRSCVVRGGVCRLLATDSGYHTRTPRRQGLAIRGRDVLRLRIPY